MANERARERHHPYAFGLGRCRAVAADPDSCVRNPDPGKMIFHQKLQQQLRILAIGLLFPHSLGANLRCVPDPQLKLQLIEHTSTSVRAHWLPSHPHLSCLERPVELLSFPRGESVAVPRPRRFRVHQCNLLKARMIVTTYNQHVRLLSSEPFGWFAPPSFTRAWEPTLLWNHFTHLALRGGTGV